MSLYFKVYQSLKKPLIIAHRGSQLVNQYPENTLPAFAEAQQLGAQGIELDIWSTLDGELAVFHDRSLSRLTGLNQNIDRCSSMQLQQVRFKGLDDGDQVRIPLLQQVFAMFGKQLFYNVEIKQKFGSYRKLICRLYSLLREYDLWEQIWLSSFDISFLWQWREYHDQVHCAYLFDNWNAYIRWLCEHKFVDFLHPGITLFPEISKMIDLTKPLCFWTVNQENDILALSSQPVFALITDNVQLVSKSLALR
ncbi:MAG: hypothetical protein A2Y94_03320 [Caldithrix sp. RBG_13_44_9]|nr:MAG: hypothetical protein A2Y94_03320 [Caldithrix sp. RBG_13_44_9]